MTTTLLLPLWKVMLTWGVITTHLINSFLNMLRLTVFCLNQLWRTARTWKFLRGDDYSFSLLCLLHFFFIFIFCALYPFALITPQLLLLCHFACATRNRGGNENSLFCVSFLLFYFFSANSFTLKEVDWQVDWRNPNFQCTRSNETPSPTHNEFQLSEHICGNKVLSVAVKQSISISKNTHFTAVKSSVFHTIIFEIFWISNELKHVDKCLHSPSHYFSYDILKALKLSKLN